jgi:hypothetical protein
MIGSSKRCTSVTKPIQLPSNLHGLNSLKLINLAQQIPCRQRARQKREHHLFLKQHNTFQLLQFFEEHGEVCPAGWNKGKPGMVASTEGVAAYLAKNAKKL